MHLRADSIDIPVGLTERRRGFRVICLCCAVALLGVGDLYNTIAHANSVGFIEANPLAEHMVYAGSHWALILFKLGSIGIATGLLLRTRHHLTAELGGWLMVAAMFALTLQWHQYNHEVAEIMAGVDAQTLSDAMADARNG